jgi:hypothetical protein
MENNQRTTITVQVPTEKEIASKREVAPISFGIALILFFFTFCDLQCTTGQKITSVSGFNLVTGKKVKPPVEDSGNYFNADPTQQGKVPPNIWAILAFLAAGTGLGVYLKKHPHEAFVGTIAGGVGAMSLFIMRIAFKSSVTAMQIVAVFKIWFWLCLLGLLLGGAISFLRWKLEGYPTPNKNAATAGPASANPVNPTDPTNTPSV